MKLLSWNIETLASVPTTESKYNYRRIADQINQIDPDIVWLPEACLTDQGINPGFHHQLRQFTYHKQFAYHDFNSVTGLFCAKKSPQHVKVILLGNYRQAIRAEIDGGIFYCVHLDDCSETVRQRMACDLLRDIHKHQLPAVVMGDFNATYRQGLAPFLMRQIGGLFRMEGGRKVTVSSLLARVSQMADGGTMQILTTDGKLVDADPQHQNTETPQLNGYKFLPSLRLLPIDHILHTPDLTLQNFQVHPDAGSDHRAISADLLLPLASE